MPRPQSDNIDRPLSLAEIAVGRCDRAQQFAPKALAQSCISPPTVIMDLLRTGYIWGSQKTYGPVTHFHQCGPNGCHFNPLRGRLSVRARSVPYLRLIPRPDGDD